MFFKKLINRFTSLNNEETSNSHDIEVLINEAKDEINKTISDGILERKKIEDNKNINISIIEKEKQFKVDKIDEVYNNRQKVIENNDEILEKALQEGDVDKITKLFDDLK